MADEVETRKRRALYRAKHRGTKELDILVGNYAAQRLALMNDNALEQFERFLALPDPVLQSWFFGAVAAPASEFLDLVADMRRFHGLAPFSETTS